MSFTGESAKTKKQAQKNAALTAWSVLRKHAKSISSSSSFSSSLSESGTNDEQEQVIIARYLAMLKPPEMKNSRQRERRTIWGSAPSRRDVIPCGDTKSLFSLQLQTWQCSQFYPNYIRTKLVPKREYPSGRTTCWPVHLYLHLAPRPQFFPFIRSMFQPDHGHYFPAYVQEPVAFIPEIGSFLYFSNRVMPFPVRSVFQVTIREIEENPQIEEWLKDDGDPDSWKKKLPFKCTQAFPQQ